jgi:hypothetical protein
MRYDTSFGLKPRQGKTFGRYQLARSPDRMILQSHAAQELSKLLSSGECIERVPLSPARKQWALSSYARVEEVPSARTESVLENLVFTGPSRHSDLIAPPMCGTSMDRANAPCLLLGRFPRIRAESSAV